MHEQEQEHLEDRSVLRLHNRAVRSVNRGLRRRVERLATHADELFVALCQTDVEAELAFRELWERGGFQPPVGPQDYDVIVERCIAALREHESRESLAPEKSAQVSASS